MARHLILGAGAVARHLNTSLLRAGDDVIIGSRSGTGVPGAVSVSLDAAEPDAVSRAANGCRTIFVCTNPPYHRWPQLWPPVIEAAISAAKSSGARIVLMGNLYGYGPGHRLMDESTPLEATHAKGLVRIRLWRRLQEAHRRGEVEATEIRASDYFGPGAGSQAHLGDSFFEALRRSRTARVIGDPGALHSWAYLPDIAAALAAAARTDTAFGQAWLVPHAPARSRLEVADAVNGLYGTSGRVRGIPRALLSALAPFVPLFREVRDVDYQFRQEFNVDSSRSERVLGLQPTSFENALRVTAESYGAPG